MIRLFNFFKRNKTPDVEVETWRKEMSGIKVILKPHMPYGEMLPFCKGFIRSIGGPDMDGENWDTVAPEVQRNFKLFIPYCRENCIRWDPYQKEIL